MVSGFSFRSAFVFSISSLILYGFPLTFQIMEQQLHRVCERTKSKQEHNQVTSNSNWPRVLLFNLAYKQCNEILNIKVGWKYYKSYIIHNVIFRPHWLRPFSSWSKCNAKPSLNKKSRQISMECFHFSEQRFPCIGINKVPIVSVQHFTLPISDYRHLNFQLFPRFSIIIPILHRETSGVWPVEMAVEFLCVFDCSRGWSVNFET